MASVGPLALWQHACLHSQALMPADICAAD